MLIVEGVGFRSEYTTRISSGSHANALHQVVTPSSYSKINLVNADQDFPMNTFLKCKSDYFTQLLPVIRFSWSRFMTRVGQLKKRSAWFQTSKSVFKETNLCWRTLIFKTSLIIELFGLIKSSQDDLVFSIPALQSSSLISIIWMKREIGPCQIRMTFHFVD